MHVGIAGAGPSGLALAVLLRRQGWAVTLVERFASPAPVGSGLMLQPTGLKVLAAMGLDPRPRGLGAQVGRILGRRAADGRVVLDVGYGSASDAQALGVHRSTLFGLLYQAALAAQVEVVGEAEVTDVEHDADDRPSLMLADRRLGPFDLVVDALGARSPLHRRFGSAARRPLPYGALWATVPWPGQPFLPDALEQRYHRASTMAGMLPIGACWGETEPVATFFWSLRRVDYPAWREAGVDAWKREAARTWPSLEPVLDGFKSADDLTFARYSHHTLACPAADRLVAIGDAAHATSPQLGQGANMGLIDAYVLAQCLAGVDGPAVINPALRRYARRRRWHVRLYQAMSLGLTPLYQSDSLWLPRIRDHLLRPLALTPVAPPILRATVSGRLLGPKL